MVRRSTIIIFLGTFIAILLFATAITFQTEYKDLEKVYCTWLTFIALSDNPYLLASWPAIILASLAGVLTVVVVFPSFLSKRSNEHSESLMKAIERDIKFLRKEVVEVEQKIEQLEKLFQKT